jgi:hypothetical protein
MPVWGEHTRTFGLAAHSLSCVVLGMAKVRLPIRLVFCGNLIVTNYEQILRILLVSRFREIERASQHRCSIMIMIL